MPNADPEAVITKRIKELPPLPVVVQKLLSVVSDEDSSASDLGDVLSADPALAAKVLKLVNSSFYGLSRKVPTISRAVVILGFSAIRNLAVGLSAHECLKGLEPKTDWTGFWEHAIHCAAGAYGVAVEEKLDDPEEAFLAGLLHDLGILILHVCFPEPFARLMARPIRPTPADEKETLGISHEAAGLRLLEHWRLPEALCRTARQHHNARLAAKPENALLRCVTVGDLLSGVAGHSFCDPHSAETDQSILREAGMELAVCTRILEGMQVRIVETRRLLAGTDEEADQGPAGSASGRPGVVVIACDHDHNAWLHAALTIQGYQPVPLQALLGQVENAPPVRLVLLDPTGIESERLVKLQQVCALRQHPAALVVDSPKDAAGLPANLTPCPRLSLLIRPEDVTPLLGGAA